MALEARIRTNDSYAPEGETNLTFELENTGDEDQYVLTWFTPLEGMFSDCLDVRANNQRLEYDGPLVKRGAPSIDNYVLIKAGKTHKHDFDLNSAYKVSRPGDYDVDLKNVIADVFSEPSDDLAGARIANAKVKAVTQALKCETAKFNVKEGGVAELTTGEKARKLGKQSTPKTSSSYQTTVGEKALPPNFVGGTPAEKATTTTAHDAGFQLCLDAHAKLGNTPEYVEWFGAFTVTRLSDVTNVYNSVSDGMKTYTLTYNLTGEGCQSNWYAYTHKGSHTVWICGVFWGAPPEGTDSQAETILHEQTHALANTDDIKYGQAECRQLALDDPNAAVKNADSYAYYSS